MIAFLGAHWLTLAPLGFTVGACVAVGLALGWPLLLNRWVLGGLAAVAAATLGAVALEARDDRIKEQAVSDLVAQNRAKETARREAISAWVVDLSTRQVAAATELRLAEQRLDLARDQRKRSSHVSKTADARCVVPRGFVYDHDAALPHSGGRADVPLPGPADPDGRSGVDLSRVAEIVDDNYTTCARLLKRVESAESRRRADCAAWDQRYGVDSGCRP